MNDLNVNLRKSSRKYLIQFYNQKKNLWQFCPMDKVQGGFDDPKEAKKAMDFVMKFHSCFVMQNYRLVERTTIIIDEPLNKFGKGW